MKSPAEIRDQVANDSGYTNYRNALYMVQGNEISVSEILVINNKADDQYAKQEKGIKSDEKKWVCNECNTPNFTESVSQDEIDEELQACINCGCFEFHLVGYEKQPIPEISAEEVKTMDKLIKKLELLCRSTLSADPTEQDQVIKDLRKQALSVLEYAQNIPSPTYVSHEEIKKAAKKYALLVHHPTRELVKHANAFSDYKNGATDMRSLIFKEGKPTVRYFNVVQHREPRNMFSGERIVDISELESTAKEITEEEAKKKTDWGSGNISVDVKGKWKWEATHHDTSD